MINIELNELIKESYYYTSKGMLFHGDTIERMGKLPDKSIDMILADLPYGTTQNKWDIVIPFEHLWEQYDRIIKDNGVIILFSQGLFSMKLQASNEKIWRYNLIWEKDRPSGFLNAKKMPLRSHEEIQVFYKKPPIYNPQFWEGEPLHGLGTKYKKKSANNNNYGEFDDTNEIRDARKGDTTKYPRSVLKFQRPHPPIHPTQKPVTLFEYLINTYTDEGNIILDNVIGSGTTAIAAENTNRKWIGIEKEQKYCDITIQRLKDLHNIYIK